MVDDKKNGKEVSSSSFFSVYIMNKELGITGIILTIFGLLLCCSNISDFGILLVIVGIIMFFIWMCSFVLNKNYNDNLKYDSEDDNELIDELDEDSKDDNESIDELDEDDDSYDLNDYLDVDNKENTENDDKENENNVEYESYVKVKFHEFSKIYTYISNPAKRLTAGELVDILSGGEICQVKVVQSDTKEIKMQNLGYKMIRFPSSKDWGMKYRPYNRENNNIRTYDDWFSR